MKLGPRARLTGGGCCCPPGPGHPWDDCGAVPLQHCWLQRGLGTSGGCGRNGDKICGGDWIQELVLAGAWGHGAMGNRAAGLTRCRVTDGAGGSVGCHMAGWARGRVAGVQVPCASSMVRCHVAPLLKGIVRPCPLCQLW